MKKSYFIFFVFIVFFGLTKVHAQIIDDGVYEIQSAIDSKKVVDLHAGNTSNGSNIELYVNNNGDNQKWFFENVGDDYYIISSFDNENQVMEVSGAAKNSGSNVALWKNNNADHQKWLIKDAGDGYYNIIAKNSGLCLDVVGGSTVNGTNIDVWVQNGGTNQKFKLKKIELENSLIQDGDYEIQSALGENFYLNVAGGVTVGANVNVSNIANLIKQKWHVKRLKNGYYSIASSINNMALDVAYASTKKGANVQLWTSNGGNNQKWLIKDAGDGYYNIISKNGGLYLDISGGSISNGANINMWVNNSGANQKFKFVTPRQQINNIEDGSYEIISMLDDDRSISLDGPALNNTNIVLSDNNNLPLQRWYVKKEDGYYVIYSNVNKNNVFDVAGGGMSNRTNVLLWNYSNSSNQKWILQDAGDGYYNIISLCNGLSLDISGGISKNGANINMWETTGGANQKFKFNSIGNQEKSIEEGNYMITSSLDGSKFLTINNNATNSSISNKNNQKWVIKLLEDGYYSIVMYEDNSKVLSVLNSSYDKGAKVGVEPKNNKDNQKWIIKKVDNGYYNIISLYNGLTLDISGGIPVNNAFYDTWVGNNGKNQKFKFIPATFGENNLEDGLYTITSILDENMVIGLDLELAFNGAKLQLETNNDLDSQKWYVNNLGDGYYKITSALNGEKVVDVPNFSYKNNTNLSLFNSNGGANQQWVFKDAGEGYYYLVSSYSSMSMIIEDEKAVENAKIVISNKVNSNSQKFKFNETVLSGTSRTIDDGYYVLETSLESNKVVDIHGAFKVNGTNAEVYKSNNGNNQIWYFKYLNNGFYSITSAMNPIISLDVEGAAMSPGTNVLVHKVNGNANQEWAVRNIGNGNYSIVSKQNGLSLEAVSSENASNVHVNKSNNSKNQKFKLLKVTSKKKYTGIDISAHQGNINFKDVHDSGLGFVIIRAGFGGDWSSQDDKHFKTYVSECEKYNIPYGLYLYSYAKSAGTSDVSASAEAKHMLRLLNEIAFYPTYYKPTLGTKVFIDIEDSSVASSSRDSLTGVANQFCDILEKSGYKCGVYASKNWFENKLNVGSIASKFDIWLAEWGQNNMNFARALSTSPAYNATAIKFWQFTSNGTLNGINGRVDLDIGYDIFD